MTSEISNISTIKNAQDENRTCAGTIQITINGEPRLYSIDVIRLDDSNQLIEKEELNEWQKTAVQNAVCRIISTWQSIQKQKEQNEQNLLTHKQLSHRLFLLNNIHTHFCPNGSDNNAETISSDFHKQLTAVFQVSQPCVSEPNQPNNVSIKTLNLDEIEKDSIIYGTQGQETNSCSVQAVHAAIKMLNNGLNSQKEINDSIQQANDYYSSNRNAQEIQEIELEEGETINTALLGASDAVDILSGRDSALLKPNSNSTYSTYQHQTAADYIITNAQVSWLHILETILRPNTTTEENTTTEDHPTAVIITHNNYTFSLCIHNAEKIEFFDSHGTPSKRTFTSIRNAADFLSRKISLKSPTNVGLFSFNRTALNEQQQQEEIE